MSIDVGKSAKHMGKLRPRDARRTDREPPKPTAKAPERRKEVRAYGFDYQSREMLWKKLPDGRSISDGYSDFKWRPHWRWHETEKQRDQSMVAWRKQHSNAWHKHYYGETRPTVRYADEVDASP